ncbi:MAG: RNA polymerase sigma factor [Pyrinomonadaceae bacterium]
MRPRVDSETDFELTLRECRSGRKPIDSLLVHPAFVKRTRRICLLHAQNEYDAEELYQDVSLKVCQSLRRTAGFPDERSFFSWLRVIARNVFFDRFRMRDRREEVSIDDLDIPDPGIDLERDYYWRELREKVRSCIASQPVERRLATELYILTGYSARETAEILNRQGIKCSHATVTNWVRDALLTVFPKASKRSAIHVSRKKSELAKVPIRELMAKKYRSKA